MQNWRLVLLPARSRPSVLRRFFEKWDIPTAPQAILEPFALAAEPSRKVAEEMGCIAMEQGELENAEGWFERAGIDRTRDPLFLMNAIRLKGMQGKPLEAERLFQRLAVLGDRVTRVRELGTKLTLNPRRYGNRRGDQSLV